jgi:hypothetical protein
MRLKQFMRTIEAVQSKPLQLLPLLLLVFGATLRLVLLVVSPPIWLDEASLLLNLQERSYLQLLAPLSYDQISPPGFSWLVKFLGQISGYSVPMLRLPAFLASVGLLFLVFRRIPEASHRNRAPYLVFLALLAFNPGLLRHTAEVKHYGFDVLATAVFLFFILDKRPLDFKRFLYGLLSLLFSFTAIFMLCAFAGTRVIQYFRTKQWRLFCVASTFGLVWAGVFLALALFSYHQVRNEMMVDYWANGFIPWSAGIRELVTWARASVMDISRSPIGWDAWGLLLLMAGTGFLLANRPARLFVMLCFCALVLAASFQLYPLYPGRLTAFMVPLLAYLAANGLGHWFKLVPPGAIRVFFLCVVLLAIVPYVVVSQKTVPVRDIVSARNTALQDPLPVYHVSGAGRAWLFYDRIDPQGPYPCTTAIAPFHRDNPQLHLSDILDFAREHPRFFLVFNHDYKGPLGSEQDLIIHWVQQTFPATQVNTFTGTVLVKVESL